MEYMYKINKETNITIGWCTFMSYSSYFSVQKPCATHMWYQLNIYVVIYIKLKEKL